MGAAMAQTAPTDVDMRTAYCIEIVKWEINFINEPLPGLEDAPPTAAMKGQLDAEHSHLRRLQLYLASRLGHVAPMGLVLATSAAKDDIARLKSVMSVCAGECGGPAQKCAECQQRVLPDWDSIGKKIQSCDELDWLPF
jgi:hypothetical protein